MPVAPNYVPTEALSNLLCAQCHKVISRFPVYCYSQGSSCGRCKYPAFGIRNEAYEALAQNLKFPCIYSEYGCLENLVPCNMEQHEDTCSFRQFKCPIDIDSECEWQGSINDLLDHCSQKHKTFILSEHPFELDFVNSQNENYLLPYGDSLYIVNYLTHSRKQTFFCTVSYLGNDPDEDISYTVILENGNKSHKVKNKINATCPIEKSALKSMLNDPISISARIEIFKEEVEEIECSVADEEEPQSTINANLLQELECMICFEYMIPPIYQCLTGHSICLNCRKRVTQCPTCRKGFDNTQNFLIAQIIEHIKYPCKYKKCKYLGKSTDIRRHEAACIYSPLDCPLKDYLICNKKIPLDQIYDHITNNHPNYLLQMDMVAIPFLEENEDRDFIKCFIIKFRKQLFKLHCLYRNYTFKFAAQLIGPPESSSKYLFEIDILDNARGKYRAYMTNSCGPITSSTTAFDDPEVIITFEWDQIRRFIKDELCFRFRISKNKMS